MKNFNFKRFYIKNEVNFIISSIVFLCLMLIFFISVSYDNDYSVYEKYGVADVRNVELLYPDDKNQVVDIPKTVNLKESLAYIVDISAYKNMDKMSFISSFPYCQVEVYADNNKIYEIKKSDKSLLNSSGYQVAIFDIPKNIKNDYIKIYIRPNLSRAKVHKIDKIKVGRKSDIIVNMFANDLASIMMSIILIVNFIISLAMNIGRKEFLKSEHYSIFYLSGLGFFVAIYFLTQAWTISYFFAGLKEFIYCAEYISFMFIMISSALFLKYKVDPKFKLVYNSIAGILVLNAIVQFILTVMNIIEFKEMIKITHVFMYISVFIIFISIIFTDSAKYPSKKSLFMPIIAIIVTTIIPLVYYTISGLLIFKNVCLIFAGALIILEAKELYPKYILYRSNQIKSELYKKLAVTDSLTGLSNRQAYEDFIKSIESDKISGWILSVDINNLKYINDNFGHIKGDKLIIDFASLLKKTQQINLNIKSFRIGGDEFFVFIRESESFDIDSFIYEIKLEYNDCKGFANDFTPSISVGYQYYDPLKFDSSMDAYNIADKMMYTDKAKYRKYDV